MKLKLPELLEKRAKSFAEFKKLGEQDELDVESEKRFGELQTELDDLDKKIARARTLADAERSAPAIISGHGDGTLDNALGEFSLRRAIVSQIPGHTEDCGRERELSAEIARRAGRPFQGIAVPYGIFHERLEKRVITSTLPGDGPGGSLIQTTVDGANYIDRLRAAMVIRKLGARVITGLVGNVDVPRLKQSASTGWVAENTALTASDQKYAPVELRPKHVGALVEFSRNMLLQSTPDIETLIRQDFAALLAEAADRAAIDGGAGNEPTGILGVDEVDGSTTMSPVSWEGVLELIESVESQDAEGNAFITNAAVVRKLRSTARLAGTDSRMIMELPRELAGYPLASTSLMPNDANSPPVTSTLLFGNFNDVLMGFWSELDILVNPYAETPYSKGNVQVRGMATCDIALRHPASFAYSSDVDIVPTIAT